MRSIGSTGRRGYTLIEMFAVLLLIGILAGFSVHQYHVRVERYSASASQTVLQSVANANLMQAMDRLTGADALLPFNSEDGLVCNAGESCAYQGEPGRYCPEQCPPKGQLDAVWSGCALTSCGYLRHTNWNAQVYTYRACRAGKGGGCCTFCPGDAVACSQRGSIRDCMPPESRRDVRMPPHCAWGYCMDGVGRVTPIGGAPRD